MKHETPSPPDTGSPTKICFVIAPIGESESSTRKRSDQVLRHIIRPSVESHGYRALRADEIAEPGMITSQVIQHVLEDGLVIADLTERNPNVYYELALRHAIKKPLIQIISKGEDLPFDIAGMRTIPVDHQDLDSVAEAKAAIQEQLKAIAEPGFETANPIAQSVELKSLRQSDDPEQRGLGEILAALGELRSTVDSIKTLLAAPKARDHSSPVNYFHETSYSEFLRDLASARDVNSSREVISKSVLELLKEKINAGRLPQPDEDSPVK